jgi:apolipoprotein N-acyltransferase
LPHAAASRSLAARPLRERADASKAALSGLLFALAQPGVGQWYLTPICLSPLIATFPGASARQRASLAWLAGTIGTLLATAVPGVVGTTSYFGISALSGLAIALGVGQLLGAALFALFGWLAGDPARQAPAAFALRCGCAWASCEFLRCHFFDGLPWVLLAYGVARVPALAQVASLAGVLGASLWLCCASALVAQALERERRRAAFVALGVLAAGVSLHAAWSLSRTPDLEAQPRLRVGVLQSDLGVRARRDPASLAASLAGMVEATRALAPLDLAVWPENAVSAVLPWNEAWIERALRALPASVPALVLGALRADPEHPESLYNAALLLGPDRRPLAHHDKVHLLPFAEYAPWPWPRDFGSGLATDRGREPTVLRGAGAPLGPLICYEVLFGSAARALVEGGAEVLVNLSNEGYWGTTGAVDQHLAAAVYRAIEVHRPLVRSTTTGVTAVIDAVGRVRAELALEQPAALTAEVEPSREQTAYTRYGDWAAYLAVAWTATSLLRDRRSIRSGSRRAAAP